MLEQKQPKITFFYSVPLVRTQAQQFFFNREEIQKRGRRVQRIKNYAALPMLPATPVLFNLKTAEHRGPAPQSRRKTLITNRRGQLRPSEVDH